MTLKNILVYVIIDFSLNGLSTEHHLRSPYKIKVNNCKFIDLVIRMEFTRAAILMP